MHPLRPAEQLKRAKPGQMVERPLTSLVVRWVWVSRWKRVGCTASSSWCCSYAARPASASCRARKSDWRNRGAVYPVRVARWSYLDRNLLLSKRRVAVIGAGMTKFMHRALETPKELAWLAARTGRRSRPL